MNTPHQDGLPDLRNEFEKNYRERYDSRLYCESEWRGWKAHAALLSAAPSAEQTAWVWNPAREEWEKVRAPGHWLQGATYAFGPVPPSAQPASPERKPLTHERILQIVQSIDPGHQYLPAALEQLARAIEAAHGITPPADEGEKL